MTWTEGVIQVTDTISIGGGYLGIILAIIGLLICLSVIVLYCVAIWGMVNEFKK